MVRRLRNSRRIGYRRLGQTFASLLGNDFGLFGGLPFVIVWFAALVTGLYVAFHGLVDLLRPVVAEEVRRALFEADRD